MNEVQIHTFDYLKPFMDVAGFISAVLSIVAYFKSKKQAQIAREAAARIELLRDEMINRRKLAETSALSEKIRALLRRTIAFGHAATEKSMKGNNRSALARNVEELLSELTHYCNGLDSESKEKIDDNVHEIKKHLAAFTASTLPPAIKEHGTQLHYSLMQISSIVTLHLDERTNDVSTTLNVEAL